VTSSFDVVVPTSGRPSLERLLERLEGIAGRVIVVRDSERRGPAWARNRGWCQSDAEWVVFLDDDVEPADDWAERLAVDIAHPGIDGSQGRVRVPLPTNRRPTDWERNVAGLETARWATADMAVRRGALVAVGGFDERFPRAYREDADLALRLLDAGFRLELGRRTVIHPVRPEGPFVSVRLQAGNADDALMSRLHGSGWRQRAGVPRGRRGRHLATAVTGAAALAFRSRALGALWLAGTAELIWRRVAPGPRTTREVATMAATSLVLPFAAAGWWLVGLARARRLVPRRPHAILLDRDGTLIEDVPYNGDPSRIRMAPGARDALQRIRRAGIPTAVVTNQSGVARGVLTRADVDAVNRRVEELAGPVGPWLVCPHGPDDGCGCRKPAPGLILRAAAMLGVDPRRCAVIGDIGTDVAAARAAGARAVLVPTAVTRPEEVVAAPEVAPDLPSAVNLLLGSAR
jgi:histidinol-phosphate phosphatase family protein